MILLLFFATYEPSELTPGELSEGGFLCLSKIPSLGQDGEQLLELQEMEESNAAPKRWDDLSRFISCREIGDCANG